MKSSPASKSETSAILSEVSKMWGFEVPRVKNLMVYELDGARIMTGGGLAMAHSDGQYVPLLSQARLLEKFPSVTVDMGAVKFVCKGANVMRPGITECGDFGAGRVVRVREERHGKNLAVGTASMSSDEAGSSQRGEVVRNIHYVSDRIWDAASALKI